MATANPNPTRISGALWRLWTEFDAIEPGVTLGGIYAAKSGYHNYRAALPANDYSVEDVAADRRGSSSKASAIDLTMNDAAMRKYTSRLDVAARARDPRLYPPAGPVLREFIGTKDNSTVYCYVLVGGRPLGVGADAGPDPGRDDSHLWHVHLSIIRQFCEDWSALDGVLSVLRGESLAAWRARTEDDMAIGDDIYRLLHDGRRPDGLPQTANGGVPIAWIVREIGAIRAGQAEQNLRDQALMAAVQGGGDVAVILARVDQRAAELAAGQQALRAQLAAELAPMLAAAIREELADVPAEQIEEAAERALERVRVVIAAPVEG